MLRRLILNADDFGFTRDVNDGIVLAHRSGILTATTLMANGAAFEHAVALAGQNPSLDIGCHLTFVDGRSVLDPGCELPATVSALLGAVAGGKLPLYEEAAAQIRKLIAGGLRPTHIDTHKHTHLLPPVLNAVTRVARDFGIRWVRAPFDFRADPNASTAKRAVARAIRTLRPRFKKVIQGLSATDHFTGFQLTGRLDLLALLAELDALPEGLTEFMCHPGELGADLRVSKTRLKGTRAVELAALVSPEARAAIERNGIKLTNYREATSARSGY